ncbi:hypothetical protein AVEN_149881-1 [Araneus ventricosus]|uniref:Uncharacterized protein n=1 Tax=Araneus ventricosus TaxID=182803 RepID=A0A4Y2E082_ARAVE|nr:hypothetical protein AVEN_149881-1 [Araneus ventricosus]
MYLSGRGKSSHRHLECNGSTIAASSPDEKKILFAGDLQLPTSPRVPFTSFDDVQPPKEKNHSVCPSPPTKRPAFLRHRQLRHFPLERSPKFRTRYFVTSQQNFVIRSYFHCRVTQQFLTGAMLRGETKIHWSRGKGKGTHFISPAFSSLGINKFSFHTPRNLRQFSHYLNKA